jgi:hypothetical protein
MDRDRVERALARIAAAAARIEAAANRAPAAPAPAGDPELARKHAELRASVAQSLGELDALIGTLEA